MPVLDKEQAQEALSKSKMVFIGTLTGFGPVRTTCSDPPTYYYDGMKFDNIRSLHDPSVSSLSNGFSYSQKGKDTSTFIVITYSDGSPSVEGPAVTTDPKKPCEGQLYFAILKDSSQIEDLIEIDDSTMKNLLRSA